MWSSLLKKSKLYRYRPQFKILFIIALIVSYIAAVLPQDLAPHISNLSDKAHHVFAFVVLGLLFRLGYKINYFKALILLVLFGGFIEVSQYFVEGRFAESKDIVADLIGSFIGLKIYKYLRRVI